ncbi:spondin-2-like [Erpetoichthys calabaricus]|uniref:spondin-2-like n=1 Tax=Erpetoichthys calabaricus TaxID=27687 RepID=UPI0010A01595|nr:spondin-2-like [Erpetoichthys calabaricus]
METTSLPASAIFLTFFVANSLREVLSEINATACQSVYASNFSLTFNAEWSPQNFPKQYPIYRPPAQWSRLFGCSHKSPDFIWTEGGLASPGLKVFVEDGNYELLAKELESDTCFLIDAIKAGVGKQSSTVTLMPDSPLISILARIIPSPDWFVGVNSLNLCKSGHWEEVVIFDLYPWDAGTDSGFVFSSPNFATEPQEPISPITAQSPAHPANSFYYPRLQKLPRLGYLEFRLLSTQMVNYNESLMDREANQTKPSFAQRTEKESSINSGVVNENSENKAMKGTPLDCEVSEWSPWGLCSHTCGSGLRQRTRYILLQPANDGEPCPELLLLEQCEEFLCPSSYVTEPPANMKQNTTEAQTTELSSAVDVPPTSETLAFGEFLQNQNDSRMILDEEMRYTNLSLNHNSTFLIYNRSIVNISISP